MDRLTSLEPLDPAGRAAVLLAALLDDATAEEILTGLEGWGDLVSAWRAIRAVQGAPPPVDAIVTELLVLRREESGGDLLAPGTPVDELLGQEPATIRRLVGRALAPWPPGDAIRFLCPAAVESVRRSLLEQRSAP